MSEYIYCKQKDCFLSKIFTSYVHERYLQVQKGHTEK